MCNANDFRDLEALLRVADNTSTDRTLDAVGLFMPLESSNQFAVTDNCRRTAVSRVASETESANGSRSIFYLKNI